MSEKFRAAAQQEDRPFMQTAARISGRIYKVRDFATTDICKTNVGNREKGI